jgi:hypothetical protein
MACSGADHPSFRHPLFTFCSLIRRSGRTQYAENEDCEEFSDMERA